MTGRVKLTDIDLSLSNIWQAWWLFKQGKKNSPDLNRFDYDLEQNLYQLWLDLDQGKYKHGAYRRFWVTDTKRRQIAVAPIRDRVIHRLLYEYLVPIYDPTFIFDAWSCRKNKGVTGAVGRAQRLLSRHSYAWVWRADIVKFFDSVNQQLLLKFFVN